MEYVIELQDGTMLSESFTSSEASQGLSLSNFFMRCGSAALSTVRCHVILLIDEDGAELRREVFCHGPKNEE